MKKTFHLLVPVMLCLLVGFLVSQLQSESLKQWYPTLVKAPLTPPNIVFPIAWTILYIFMGLSFGLLNQGQEKPKFIMLFLFIAQLVLNIGWSLVFFYFRCPGGGLAVIILLAILLLLYAGKAWRVNRLSSILFWPYIGWVAFASYLNAYIYLYNY